MPRRHAVLALVVTLHDLRNNWEVSVQNYDISRPPETRPADGLAIDFVVLPDRAQLGEIVQRVRDGRLRTNIGNVATLDDAVAAFNPTERISGQTIIRVRS